MKGGSSEGRGIRFDRASQTPGPIPTMVVSLVLFFACAWLCHEVGAPQLLGGLAAGLALARRCFPPFGLALHLAGPAMVPRGEVGLIFAEPGRTSGLFGNEVYAALIIVIAFTAIAAPLLLKGFTTSWEIAAGQGSGGPGKRTALAAGRFTAAPAGAPPAFAAAPR